MSLKLVHLAAEIEDCDDFHIARLILLLNAAGGLSNKPVQGIMKLAKMDFLLRYPNCLVRALKAVNKEATAQEIPTAELNTIEARMIRFRFGPWDKRYRRWIGLLMSKGLADAYLKGRTVNVKLTPAGIELAAQLSGLWKNSVQSQKEVRLWYRRLAVTLLQNLNFVYEVFPEIVDMQWGRYIDL